MSNRARTDDVRSARRLSVVSVAVGTVVAVVAVVSGLSSGSLSLVGFGLDAAIDSAASVVLVWRFTIETRDAGRGAHAEHLAERMIGTVLIVAAVALLAGSVRSLLLHGVAEAGIVQAVLLIASLAVLPPLAYAKRRVAVRLDSNALRKDALLTAAGAALAAVALVAGQLAPLVGLWWADSVGSIVIAVVLAREGLGILRGSD